MRSYLINQVYLVTLVKDAGPKPRGCCKGVLADAITKDYSISGMTT
jgi:hypothetical protein